MPIKKSNEKLPKPESNVVEDEGEESDEYEVGDEEGDFEERSDEDDGEEEGEGLTALLLGGNVGDDDGEDTVWVPDGGKEPAEYSGDEEEEEEKEKEKEATPSPRIQQKAPGENGAASSSRTHNGGKKRIRDEVDDSAGETQKEKKTKGN